MAFVTYSAFGAGPDTIGASERASSVAPLDSHVADGTTWERVVSRFDGVCQEQLFTYARLRWPGVQLEPVLFSENGETVGGALVMLQTLPLGLATIALVKWAPMLANAERPDAGQVMARMVAALVAEYADTRKMMLSIMPKAEPGPGNAVQDMLAGLGFRPGVGVKFPERYLVDVRLGHDARLAAFGQKWRYNLRKAMKAGLAFAPAEPDEFGRFMTLYEAMSARKLFPDHSGIATAGALMAMPEGTARPQLFFVDHCGRTVAGAMIFTAGDTACYLYGATDDAALDLRAGYFLHWEVIRWLRENTRARFYDLGGTDGFAGLQQFKAGMVGEAGHIVGLPPAMNYASDWRAMTAGTLAYKGREWVTRSRDRIVAARLDRKRARKRKAI